MELSSDRLVLDAFPVSERPVLGHVLCGSDAELTGASLSSKADCHVRVRFLARRALLQAFVSLTTKVLKGG
jgi:hypothetical protein